MGCKCSELHSCMLMLHLNENRLTEEVVTVVSMFDSPQHIFPLVHSLKKEGNELVRAGDFKQAVTIYTKAATYLVLGLPCCGNDYHPFRDLAIPINLNLAMCALKLSEFQMAKCLYDCVLKFEPLNVKALFRRASAALSLGWILAAEGDLLIAREVEPKNSKVLKEWNKLVLLRDKQISRSVEGIPREADMDLDVKLNVPSSLGVRPLDFNPLHLPSTKKSKLTAPLGSAKVGTSVNEEYADNLVGSKANFQESTSDPLNLDKEIEDINSRPQRSFPKPNLAEPKRFSNQSRPGSFLNIPQPDYRKLASGRVFNYMLPHSLGFMSVRVKRMDTDPFSIPKVPEFDLVSTSPPEDLESVGDNMEAITHDPEEHVQHFSTPCLDPLPPVIQDFSLILNIVADKSDTLINFKTSRSLSQLVRPHQLPFTSSKSAINRRKMRLAKRVAKDRIQLCPGMKRKGSSNTFISCYPSWKRRPPFNIFEMGHTMGFSDQGSFKHHSKVTQWSTLILDSTPVTKLNFVPEDKLTSALPHQGQFYFV